MFNYGSHRSGKTHKFCLKTTTFEKMKIHREGVLFKQKYCVFPDRWELCVPLLSSEAKIDKIESNLI